MKNLIFVLFFLSLQGLQAQKIEKIFLTILDEYVKIEASINNSFDKDKIIIVATVDSLVASVDSTSYEYVISIGAWDLETYSFYDSIKMYKGYKIAIFYPKSMDKKLSKYFKPLDEILDLKTDKYKGYETTSNCVFQINAKNEIYYFFTPDDCKYYKNLKKRKIKFSKNFVPSVPENQEEVIKCSKLKE